MMQINNIVGRGKSESATDQAILLGSGAVLRPYHLEQDPFSSGLGSQVDWAQVVLG